jgi:hypothetical protein
VTPNTWAARQAKLLLAIRMFDSKDLMRNFKLAFMLVLLPGAWRFIANGHMYVVGTRYMYPATIIAHEVVLIYMAAHC